MHIYILYNMLTVESRRTDITKCIYLQRAAGGRGGEGEQERRMKRTT